MRLATPASPVAGTPRFQTTSWTQIRQVGTGGEQSRLALSDLCDTYWYPTYVQARRRGLTAEDAEDATQGFFAWLLESNVISRAEQGRGRFRSFLMTAMDQFLARRREYESAAKRRPERPIQSLSGEAAERRFAAEPVLDRSPEDHFDRAWAIALIDRATTRLRDEWAQSGKLERYELLQPLVIGEESTAVAGAARKLNMSEGAVRVAVHRLRTRYATILRDEVARTLDGADQVDDELRYLRAVLRPHP